MYKSLPLYLLSLFMLLPASITWAQTISSQKGLTTAIFTHSKGKIIIYLPYDIRPGDLISGTIVAEPFGDHAKQKEKNLAELVKHSVKLDGNNFSVAARPSIIKWHVHKDRKISVPLELLNSSGQKLEALNCRIVDPSALNAGSENCNIPTHALTAAPVIITGSFDGDLQNTNITLNNQPIQLLAESPRQCQVKFPEAGQGLQTLQISENGARKCSGEIMGVDMSVTHGGLDLRSGQKTYIDIKLTGLNNLPGTGWLMISNMTPGVVSMTNGNVQVVPVFDNSADKGGIFSIHCPAIAIATGTFTVDINLDLPASNNSPQYYNIDWNEFKNESGYPGSYGFIGDQPCDPEGKTITWRWKRAFTCETDESKVVPCGHTKQSADLLDKIKELLEEVELDKANDIAEKMSKAFTTSKMFSYSIHLIRRYYIIDVSYKCVNGKWQPVGGLYISEGTDDLGWHSVNRIKTFCWTTFDSPAEEQEFKDALEFAIKAVCK